MTPNTPSVVHPLCSPPAAPNAARRRAFSLIELLIVIGIMALVLALAFPMLTVMRRVTSGGAAESAVDVAVKTARAMATQSVADLKDTNPVGFPGATYSGTACIFTPGGEVRIVQNEQTAHNGASALLEPNRNGFADISSLDYVRLPRHAGVVGIIRGNRGDGTNELLLLAPPFAVRFDNNGTMIAGTDSGSAGSPPPCSRLVYYDGNYDNKYETSAGLRFNRTSIANYDPDNWDPRVTPAVQRHVGTAATTGGETFLPFEEIETVVGVLVFDINDLRNAIATKPLATAGSTRVLNTAAQDWLLTPDPLDANKLMHAKALFFSRYSGTLMRDAAP